jgi:hypothetical protein
MSRPPKLIEALTRWRAKFEVDPTVTYEQIARAVGRCTSTVREYAAKDGWTRTPQVQSAALKHISRIANEKQRQIASKSADGLTAGDRREACRAEWEADAAVTFRALADRLGMEARNISSHAKRRGWTRSPEVLLQAAEVKAKRNAESMRKAIANGYKPDVSAARAAKEAIAKGEPTKRTDGRRYPAWDTRQKEREYTPSGPRYASVFHYASGLPAKV